MQIWCLHDFAGLFGIAMCHVVNTECQIKKGKVLTAGSMDLNLLSGVFNRNV